MGWRRGTYITARSIDVEIITERVKYIFPKGFCHLVPLFSVLHSNTNNSCDMTKVAKAAVLAISRLLLLYRFVIVKAARVARLIIKPRYTILFPRP